MMESGSCGPTGPTARVNSLHFTGLMPCKGHQASSIHDEWGPSSVAYLLLETTAQPSGPCSTHFSVGLSCVECLSMVQRPAGSTAVHVLKRSRSNTFIQREPKHKLGRTTE